MQHYFCHVCATCLPLQFSKIIIFSQQCTSIIFLRKIITTYISCINQNEQKIIFCYRIIITNVVFTRIFINHFAKAPQLLQKAASSSALYSALFSFLLFRFQFIPHSWFTYFAPTRTLINAAAKNCMNDFAYCSCSLAVSFSTACTSSYTKKTYSMKQLTHFAHKILITIPYV